MAGRIPARVAVLGIFLAGLPMFSPAQAAWSTFAALPTGALTSDPSCATESSGIGFCAAVGAGGKLMYSRYSGASWSAWKTLSTIVTAAPSCTSAGAGKVICATRNAALDLIALLDTGGTVSPFVTVSAAFGSAPGCASLGGTQVLCAGRGPGGKLVAATYGGSGWAASSWTAIAPAASTVYSPVTCAVNAGGFGGGAVCAWLGTGSTIATRAFSGTTWTAELNLGGTATNPPDCTPGAINLVVGCFATGTDSAMYGRQYNDGAWAIGSWPGNWGSFGGVAQSYSCAGYATSASSVTYACGALGMTTSGFFTNEYSGGNWSGWLRQGTGTYIGTPSCFTLSTSVSPAKVMCVATKPNGQAASTVGP